MPVCDLYGGGLTLFFQNIFGLSNLVERHPAVEYISTYLRYDWSSSMALLYSCIGFAPTLPSLFFVFD